MKIIVFFFITVLANAQALPVYCSKEYPEAVMSKVKSSEEVTWIPMVKICNCKTNEGFYIPVCAKDYKLIDKDGSEYGFPAPFMYQMPFPENYKCLLKVFQ